MDGQTTRQRDSQTYMHGRSKQQHSMQCLECVNTVRHALLHRHFVHTIIVMTAQQLKAEADLMHMSAGHSIL